VIRVALRQFRAEGTVGITLLGAFAIVLAITGPNLAHVYDAFESSCKAARDCATAPNPVLTLDKPLQSALPYIVLIAPALAGLFFGAPLIARELETGTFRLAWTQSVTRNHWLAVKLGLVGIAAMAIGGLLTWMADWWASPVDAVDQNRFGVANFSFHGVAPIGYAAFAFALGATAGVLLRRTVAAMAVTGVGFAAARLAVTYWVRPNLASPVRQSLPLSADSGPGFVFGEAHGPFYLNVPNIPNGFHTPGTGEIALTAPQVNVPNGWVYSTTAADKAGHAPTSHYLFQACPVLEQASKQFAASAANTPVAKPQLNGCITRLSATFHTILTYQPASRFWPFQWAEMGIFLAAALALCGLTYWWLRRHYA
jgi:hypothetical protein